ncbi:MAG: NADH-quinone oxidoreductase subunit D [Micropruina sp.]
MRLLIGSLGQASGDSPIDLGPTHPGRAGMLALQVAVSQGIVRELDVEPGALHRGAEMLFEVRDYRQILGLANRHDWQAPFFGELLMAVVVEESLGVEIPERALWLRTLLAEHFRIVSHLAYLTFSRFKFLGTAETTDSLRELLRFHISSTTGNRVHPMAVRLGGMGADPTAEWLKAERDLCRKVAREAEDLRELMGSRRHRAAAAGLAPITASQVAEYGLSGPIGRASGVDQDLRRRKPSLAYARLASVFDGPRAEASGDAQARFEALADEVLESVRLIEACIDALPAGAVAVQMPKVVKMPEGDAYAELEAPLGRAGVFVVSRGDKTPWRVKLRTPSFANVSAWGAVLPGCPVDLLDVAIASLPYVAGDLDK